MTENNYRNESVFIEHSSEINFFDIIFNFVEHKKIIFLSITTAIICCLIYYSFSQEKMNYSIKFSQASNIKFLFSPSTIEKINEIGFTQDEFISQLIHNLTDIQNLNKSAEKIIDNNVVTFNKEILLSNYLKNMTVEDNKLILVSGNEIEVNKRIIKNHLNLVSSIVLDDFLSSLNIYLESLKNEKENLRREYYNKHMNKKILLEAELINLQTEIAMTQQLKLKRFQSAFDIAKGLGIEEPMANKDTFKMEIAVIPDIGDNIVKNNEKDNVPPFYLGTFLLNKLIKNINQSEYAENTREALLISELKNHDNLKSDAFIPELVDISTEEIIIENIHKEVIESSKNFASKNPFIYYDDNSILIEKKDLPIQTSLLISTFVGLVFSFLIFIFYSEFKLRKNKNKNL